MQGRSERAGHVKEPSIVSPVEQSPVKDINVGSEIDSLKR
jgi:hypothetical protein